MPTPVQSTPKQRPLRSPPIYTKASNPASSLDQSFSDLDSLSNDELEILAIQARKRQILTYENAMLARQQRLAEFEAFEKSLGIEGAFSVPEKKSPSVLAATPRPALVTQKPVTLSFGENGTAYETSAPAPAPQRVSYGAARDDRPVPRTAQSPPSMLAQMRHAHTAPAATAVSSLHALDDDDDDNFAAHHPGSPLERMHSTETIKQPPPVPAPAATAAAVRPVSVGDALDTSRRSIDSLHSLMQEHDARRHSDVPWRDVDDPSFLHDSLASFHLDLLRDDPLEGDEDEAHAADDTGTSESIPAPSKFIATHFPILARTLATTTTSGAKRDTGRPSVPAATTAKEARPTGPATLAIPIHALPDPSSPVTPRGAPSALPFPTPGPSESAQLASTNLLSAKSGSTESVFVQRERQHLERAKVELDKAKLAFKKEKDAFEALKKEEWSKIEEEKRKMKRERMLFEKNKKLNETLPTKRDRQEVEALKNQIQELHEIIKQKETKARLTEERYKQRLDQLTKENKELKEEVLFLQSAPNLAVSPASAPLKEKTKHLSSSLPTLQTSLEKVVSSEQVTPKHSMAWQKEFEKVEQASQLGPALDESIVKDGLRQRRYANGVRVILFKNGTTKEYHEGLEITRYTNDDKKEVYANGTMVYFFAASQIRHTELPEGTVINEFPDGQIEEKSKDGVNQIKFPNGSRRVVYPSGEREDYFPDGTIEKSDAKGNKTILHADGSKEFWTKEKRKRVLPNGETKIIFPDGTRQRISSDGRVQLMDSLGNILKDDIERTDPS